MPPVCLQKEVAGRGTSVIRQVARMINRIGKKNNLKNLNDMARTNVRRGDTGHGAEFRNERRAVDEAINERIKSENEANKLDPRSANNKMKAEYRPRDSTKKSGRSKH